jgi:hypothetical protein
MNFWFAVISVGIIFYIAGFITCAIVSSGKITDLYAENDELKIEGNRKDQVIDFYKSKEKENNTKTKSKKDTGGNN